MLYQNKYRRNKNSRNINNSLKILPLYTLNPSKPERKF